MVASVLKAAYACQEAYTRADYNKNGTAYIVVEFGGWTCVAFRGTEASLTDILTDLRFRSVDTEIGRVHRGMWEALPPLPKATLFTGHSLGGGLAALAAAKYHAHAITFGAPAVGRFNAENQLRVVGRWDIVAASWLSRGILGRKHVGVTKVVNSRHAIASYVRALEKEQ